jgi:hypothetical protein
VSGYVSALLLLSATLLSLGAQPQGCHTKQKRVVTKIYADAEWYCDRRESEKSWRGVLQKRDAPLGPATRPSQSYVLVTNKTRLPVYAANVDGQLAPYVGRRVVVRGKLVDLTRDGFGEELWVASIRSD